MNQREEMLQKNLEESEKLKQQLAEKEEKIKELEQGSNIKPDTTSN